MPSIVQLLGGPSCPLTVGSAEVKRERKSERKEWEGLNKCRRIRRGQKKRSRVAEAHISVRGKYDE